MHFDFAALLVLLTVLTGGVWAIDAMFFRAKRRTRAEEIGEAAKEPVVVEYGRSFFPVILAVLIIRSFLVEPFKIPSSSMMPTLLTGDFILVNKFAYGVRIPVLETKILDIGEPQRGDVAVFRFPSDPSEDYIKRVVGLPGDEITYRDKILYINGEPQNQIEIGPYIGPGAERDKTLRYRAQERQEMLDGEAHNLLIHQLGGQRKNRSWTVPPGHYFVMGDNRDNSNDSREWGFVPEDNLVGKAFFIWMHFDSAAGGFDWSRIGNSIE